MYDYTKMIHSSVKKGNMRVAWHFFVQMKLEGVQPTVVTYDILMHGCLNTENIKGAFALWNEMIEAKILPNVRAFNTVFAVCALTADVTRALTLFGQMKKQFRLKPDVITYGTLLNVCAKAGDVRTAVALVNEMTVSEIRGNVVIFTTLLDCYAEATTPENGMEHWKNCLKLLDVMRARKIVPDTWTYTTLSKVCSRAGLMKKPTEILDMMHKDQVNPDVIVFTAMIDGLSKARNLTKDEVLLEKTKLVMEMKKQRVKPNPVTYGALIDLSVAAGDLIGARYYFDEMKRNGVEPNMAIYGMLLHGFERLGDPSKKSEYLTPCLELFREMEKKGVLPDALIFKSLLFVCANAGDLDAALMIWSKLRESKLSINRTHFGAMIKASLNAGDLAKASRFVQEMENKHNIKPSKTICHSFLQFFESRNMKDEAEAVLQAMQHMKTEFDDGPPGLSKTT